MKYKLLPNTFEDIELAAGGEERKKGVLLYDLSSKPSSQKYANNYQRKPGNPENFQAFLIFITSQHSVVLKSG